MTTLQLCLFNCFYLAVLVAVAFFTRATARRIVGALAGGTAFGVVALGIIVLGERARWWHMVITWEPYFVTLLLVGFALVAFIYLITWRIARRFGWRGLTVAVIVAAVIGPPRDYWYMARFPEWGTYGPGIAPVLAVAATYALMVVLGHGVMRLVAGPARADRLARRPWEPAEPDAPPNGGPAARSGNSGATQGPPSVS
jgi:hypothetical protein